MDGIWVHPYSRITCAGGGGFQEKWGMAEPVWCCGVMFEAVNPHCLQPTSTFNVYKVFEHLKMLQMGIWVYSYSRITCAGVGKFQGKWGMAEPV